jgi:hypothetical protein
MKAEERKDAVEEKRHRTSASLDASTALYSFKILVE